MTGSQRLGFIGYGAMASRMGRRLADAGHEILIHTASGRPHAGARTLDSARALAAEADIVLVSVPNDAALEAAMYGESGALAGARAGGLLINLSSVSPGASLKLAKAGLAQNLAILDAPVSGSTPEAEAGTLIVLAGGEKADFIRAEPIFSIIAAKAVYVGPAGQGSILKLVVNGIMGAGMTALAEAVGYGLAAGLDPDTLFDTLDGVAVLSAHHKRKLGTARSGNFAPQFPTSLMHKDIALLQNESAALGLPVPTIAAATQTLALSRPENDSADYSAVIGIMRDLAAKRR